MPNNRSASSLWRKFIAFLKEGPFKFRLLKVYIVFETAILLTELVSVKGELKSKFM